jgi:HTH-type transcriptional regulator / antitoxin HigA
MTERAAFHPDWISAPGDTIRDILKQRRISEAEFARKLGTSAEEIHKLLLGREAITSALAEKLGSSLGGSTAFWSAREKRYRDGLRELACQAKDDRTAEWLKNMPIADMVRFGWIPTEKTQHDKVAACLRFFGVDTVEAWSAAYRAVMDSGVFRTSPTFESKPGAVAAWLRRGELESAAIECGVWKPSTLQKGLQELRGLTRERDPSVFIPRLRRRLSESGVAVVVLRAPSGCRASGATRFLTKDKALMLLSFRYLSDDQFWFSVFHEVGHLLLHPHRLFIDAPGMPRSSEEKEANEFAANTLVLPEYQSELMDLPVDGRAVIRFARKIGIAPGIVVGQMQHHGRLQGRQLNNLKRRYVWSAE